MILKLSRLVELLELYVVSGRKRTTPVASLKKGGELYRAALPWETGPHHSYFLYPWSVQQFPLGSPPSFKATMRTHLFTRIKISLNRFRSRQWDTDGGLWVLYRVDSGPWSVSHWPLFSSISKMCPNRSLPSRRGHGWL